MFMASKPTNGYPSLAYSLAQVTNVTGLSTYMVDYLCRNGLVTPSGNDVRGRGRPRRYTFADIVLLRVVAKLLSQGISVLGFRKSFLSAKQRRDNVREILARRYLVTDGVEVYLENRGMIERIDSGQLAFAFILDLDPIRNELSRNLKIKVG
jgi:DNA-binding transcriptional MerR regulator